MNRLKKEMYKDPKLAKYFNRQTELYKAQHDLFEVFVQVFKIREICDWLENLLRKFK